MTTLVLATRNGHKVREICGILGDRFRYQTLDDFAAAPTVVEDAGSFAGNARKKAVTLARWLAEGGTVRASAGNASEKRFVLADDSGLEVDALGGAPGVHSARFAALDGAGEGNAPDRDNNAKLLRLLQAIPSGRRSARFRCVIAFAPVLDPAPANASPVCYADDLELNTELFEGTCEGEIGFEPRGRNGFGYDPLFTPAGHDRTFAELGDEVKNQLSHRARALHELKRWLERR